jgi:hypothetical protein
MLSSSVGVPFPPWTVPRFNESRHVIFESNVFVGLSDNRSDKPSWQATSSHVTPYPRFATDKGNSVRRSTNQRSENKENRH